MRAVQPFLIPNPAKRYNLSVETIPQAPGVSGSGTGYSLKLTLWQTPNVNMDSGSAYSPTRTA